MNYLLSNLDIECDFSQYPLICFHVRNRNLDTFWIVEHTNEELQQYCEKFGMSRISSQQSIETWSQQFLRQVEICDKEDKYEFFQCKPTRFKHPKYSRSYSQFIYQETPRLRYTLSQKQKQYQQIHPDYHVRFKDLNTIQDFEKFLRSLSYKNIRIVGKGVQSHTFKVFNTKDDIVAVKIQHNTPESLQAALLQSELNQDAVQRVSAHLSVHQILEVEDILIIEEELASQSLEDVLLKKAQYGQKFSDDEIRHLLCDLSSQLYTLHIERSTAHNDIKPENILLQDGHFILHDYGEMQFINEEYEEITKVVGTLLYMSPIKLQHYHSQHLENQLTQITLSIQSLNNEYKHNPFKSDIYSVGLILLRVILHNHEINTYLQIDTIFYHNRNEYLPKMLEKYEYYYYDEALILWDGVKMIKSLLHLMLEESEEQRISTLDLNLFLNNIKLLHTPYSKHFLPQVTYMQNSIYKVYYPLKDYIYEGEFDEKQQIRNGRGVITRNGHILYQGEWKNDNPHGVGMIHIQRQGGQFQYNEVEQDYGKVVNNYNLRHSKIENIQIKGHFYNGMLDGECQIEDLVYQYKQNIQSQICKQWQLKPSTYYKFIINQNITQGYQQYSDITTIDITEIQDISIILKIIQSIQIKVQEIEFHSLGELKQIMLGQSLKIIFSSQEHCQKKKEVVEKNEKKRVFCCIVETHRVSNTQYTYHMDIIESKVLQHFLSNNHLTTIKLNNGQFYPDALQCLHQRTLNKLQTLDLNGCALDDDLMSRILLSEGSTYLKILNLSNTQVGKQTIEALIQSDAQLHKLYLSNCPNCTNFELYVTQGKANKIITLDLSNNEWVELAYFQLLYLPLLKNINLTNTKINLKKFKLTLFGKRVQFFDSPNLDININVKVLHSQNPRMSHTQKEPKLSNETLKILSKKPIPVERLNFSGLISLSQGVLDLMPALTSLISLDLSETSVTGDVLNYIQQYPLNKLRRLIMRNCHLVGEESLLQFSRSVRGAQIHVFHFNSQLVSSKKQLQYLKYLTNLKKTSIIVEEKNEDISLFLKQCLSWVAALVLKGQMIKFYLDISKCDKINDGFDLFILDQQLIQDKQFKLKIKIHQAQINNQILSKIQKYVQ